MIIVPVNVSEITRSVLEMLRDSTDVGGAGVRVERSEEFNKTPTTSGWVGIYRERVDYPARALGMGTGYRNQLVRLVALVQESDMSSGEECEDRLEALLQKVVGVLLSDPSLKGMVETLDEFSVVYEAYDKANGLYFQNARIHFTGVIPVSAM